MLVDALTSLRARVVDDFCAVMEFKAFTDLAYRYSVEFTKRLPQDEAVAIGYSEFAHSVGLSNKVVPFRDLPQQFVRAKDNHFFELVHQSQVALFENFFFELLRLLLTDRPVRLPAKRQIEYSVIVAAQSKDEIVTALIERELNELKYKGAREWFAYLGGFASACQISDDDLNRIAEAKATRDLLAHNAGIVNAVYVQKAGRFARFKTGDRVSVAGDYTRDAWQLFLRVLLAAIDCLVGTFKNEGKNA